MPLYLNDTETWKSFWPIILLALGLAFLVAMLAGNNRQRRGQIKELFFVLASFSMLGIVTGYSAGLSRESVLGTVLPAVLSLIGGLAIFLIEKKVETRLIVSTSIFIFTLALLIGIGWGAFMREEAEEYKKSADYLKKKAVIETEVNEFRRNLDLPPLQFDDNKATK